MRKQILGAVGLAVLIIPAVSADVRFTPKPTRDYDVRGNEGYCAIRVWVDDEVNIFLQGDRVIFESVRGREPRDAGSECSQPMPRGNSLSNFEFRGIDGRGRVELIEEPTPRNNFRAWVRIRDEKGGAEEHHFRLMWRNLWTNQAPRGGIGRGNARGGFGRGNRAAQGYNGVCFYSDTDFEGEEFCVETGQHVPNVGPEWNDRFRSMRLFGRAREVEMFDDQNFGGGTYRATREISDLSRFRDSRGQRLDRRITSFRIY